MTINLMCTATYHAFIIVLKPGDDMPANARCACGKMRLTRAAEQHVHPEQDGEWVCYCGYMNSKVVPICTHCGTPRPVG